MKRAKQSAADLGIPEMEFDLGMHLKDRIYKALYDHRDTAEIGGVDPQKATALAIAVLLDAAMTGLVTIGMRRAQIDEIVMARIDMALEEYGKQGRKR